MTLQNLKYALYLNNLILLEKMKNIETANSHIHDNADVLSNLSDSDGMLIYKGEPITSLVVTEEQLQQAITDTINLLKEE